MVKIFVLVGMMQSYKKQGVPMQLTNTQIKGLKPLGKAKKYFDGGGLFLFVSSSGTKLWRMTYRFDRKEKLLSFGEYPTISLKDARNKREEAKKLLAEGIDPSEHKKAAQAERMAEAQNSFRNVALEWHEHRTTEFCDKYRASLMFRMDHYLFSNFGKKPIAKLEAQDILAVVRPLEQVGKMETAHRLVQLTGQVLRYAIITGRAKHNVAADLRGALRTRKVVHRASITDPKRVGQLLMDIEHYSGYFPLICALRLAPLFFVRPSELRSAEWSEFNFETKEWRIAAQRMKMKEQHIVPLSTQALEILQALKNVTGNGRYLFPSIRTNTRPMSDVAMLNALRRMGYEKHEMCTHAFRFMASTLLNELGYNRDWIERQLAHSERDEVRAAYNYAQYLPERRRMMQEWADYLQGLKEQTTNIK